MPKQKPSARADNEMMQRQLELLDERLLEVVSLRQTIFKEVKDKKIIDATMKNAQKKAKELGVDPKLAQQVLDLVSKVKK